MVHIGVDQEGEDHPERAAVTESREIFAEEKHAPENRKPQRHRSTTRKKDSN